MNIVNLQKSVGSIFFVTGRSCAGKSELWKSLKGLATAKQIALHDIDEDGVPAEGRRHWRPFRVEQLYAQALVRARKGKTTVVFGISLPHEVIDCDCFDDQIPVYFVLLEVSQKDFDQRMKSRLRLNNELSMWPEIRQPNQKLAKSLRNQIINQKNALIQNSSSSSKKVIAKTVWDFIQKNA